MTLLYLDASALLKLVVEEAESQALRSFVGEVDLASSEILFAEAPRALRRMVARGYAPGPVEAAFEHLARDLEAITLVPVDGGILVHAGSLDGAGLRSLDAIHVASAKAVRPIEAFVTYDARQATAAEHAGLRTAAPGT